jgi:hypothetical protein
MKKTNLEIFNELPSGEYLKSSEAARKIFRDMAGFPDALGFDKQSGGFLALHRDHAPSGFNYEIPVCIFLKNNGFRVVLTAELPNRKSVDATINEVSFEIKQIAHAKNFTRAVLHQLRHAYHKCDNILLHIAQPVKGEQVRNALSAGLKNYASIKLVWVVVNGSLYQLDRLTILGKQYRIV